MRILVVEDSAVYRHLLCDQLSEFQVHAVSDAESALPIVCTGDEAIVLLIDWELPDMSGSELVARIRKSHLKHYVYAIVITAREDKADLVIALDAGADDYLVKPLHEQELRARIRVAFRTLSLHEELIEANARLELLASEDPLTALLNRRALMDAFHREILRARRQRSPLTIVMCDIDSFKQINDRLGHAIGDEVLCAVAHALKSSSRGSDIVARTGGDEFLLVLSDTDAHGGAVVTERVQLFLREKKGLHPSPVPVSLSYGIAEVETDETEEAAASRADAALYAAKQAGRDQYRVAQGTSPNDIPHR